MANLRKHQIETLINTWNVHDLDFKIVFTNRLHLTLERIQKMLLYSDVYRKGPYGKWIIEEEFKPIDENSPLALHLDKMLYRFVIDFQVLEDIIKNKPC